MAKKYIKKLLCAVLTAGLVAAFFVPMLSSEVSQGEQQKPAAVRHVSVHDPSIVKADGTYYVFGSHLADAKSSNLMSWQQMNRDWNFRGNGTAWQNDSVYGKTLENLSESFQWAGYDDGDCKEGLAVWAPDVIYNPDYLWSNGDKGAYMLYYSASSTWNKSCIGYAVSKDIEGSYEYVDTVIYSGFTTHGDPTHNSSINTKWDNDYLNLKQLIADGRVSDVNSKWFTDEGGYNSGYAPNAIDPTVFYGKDGKMYMTYGSWSGGIFVLELDMETGDVIYPGTDSTESVSGNYTDRYFGTRVAGGNYKSGEGPYILYDEESDYYYLYETYGGLTAEGGYNMRLFRSKNVYGPYMDAAGRNAKDSVKDTDKYGIKLIGNYAFTGQPGYRAAGHNSAFIDDDGQRYLIYHQRFNQPGNQTEYHEVRVRKQFLNEDNWPVTAVYEYRGEEIAHYSNEAVVGTYEIINHGTSSDGNMIYPGSIDLYADGTIRGDMTGTWQKTTKNGKEYDYITLKAGNKTYKGVLYQQFNEESSSRSVMTFSAIGNDNTSLWGTRTGDLESSESYRTHLIYGFDFENVSGEKINPVTNSAKSGQAVLKGSASVEQDSVRGRVLRIRNAEGAKAVSYLQLPSDTLSTVSEQGYTVSMWINVGTDTWDHSALFEANATGRQGEYPMTRMGVNLLSRINASSTIDPDNYDDSAASNLSRNEWHHAVYSVNSLGICVYLDGTKVAATSKNIKGCFAGSNAGRIQNAVNVMIGSGAIFGDEDVRDAKFDDVAIYDTALSLREVQALQQAETIEGLKPAITLTPKPTSTPLPDGNQNTSLTPSPGTSGTGNVTEGNSGLVKQAKALRVTIKSVKSKTRKKVTLKWKKVSKANGYQIQYSTKRNFKSAKKIQVKKSKTVKRTISKLKSQKYYYFRMRTYKTVAGKKIYGKYSKVKKIKVK